jgi:hypothetical protein
MIDNYLGRKLGPSIHSLGTKISRGRTQQKQHIPHEKVFRSPLEKH